MKTTAEMDGLTRIYNKKHLEQTLNELIYRAACTAYDQRAAGAATPGQVLSVFLFDIDNFKNYNDTNGHLAGDKLLQELASLVNEAVRKDDIFGRFGGEEFLLIMPHTDVQPGARRGREDPRAARRRTRSRSPTSSRSSGSASAAGSPSTRCTASTRTACCTRRTRRSTRPSAPAATACCRRARPQRRRPLRRSAARRG